MSTINANVADYLTQIEKLTNTNLQILKGLNDSFYTKKNHIYANINDTTYVLPSFISLENKVNMLQENFQNLVKAPETCEAYFNFDGNTRSIEVRKYSHVPDSIVIPTVTKFSVDNNDIFKDFMTPVPYINIDLPYLPNDIVEVNVKKIVPKSETLKGLFKSKLEYTTEIENIDGSVENVTTYYTSINENYGNIYKLLLNYKEDVDYVEYDTIYKLPVRKNIGTATYVIESILSDVIDDNLNEIITLKLRNNLSDSSFNNKLTYKLFDDTIEKSLQIGDELINYDGTGKVVITDIRPATHTISVKVVNGEYLNFIGTDSYDSNNDTDIHDLSKLRFYSAIDFTKDKYVKIPMEEDQYVFIAIAALNSRMNVQSSWGTGIIVDTHKLLDNNEISSFKTYYNENVKNIGDVLFEMTSMITSPITSINQDTFEAITSLQPKVSKDILKVMQINKHLNNSTTVKNIRDAYNQKMIAENELSEVQNKINDINTQLSNISFDDTSGIRSMYTSQLTSLNNKKNELVTVINNSINTISLNVNSAEIPIENAKYRIRGFYIPNLDVINGVDINKHVIGLKVQYRYKNVSSDIGNAVSINGTNNDTYIYSDWNELNTHNKLKIANCVDGKYLYHYEENNENINEPSYNQIDIPISQGETVDIRVKVVYDFGQPYITTMSNWSDIINIEFPSEFTKDVPILTIIEENNNDIETNRFNNILLDNGITEHINDSIVDQNIIYYHKPDNIASGFYTNERRIIPLKDKLVSLSNDIAQMKTDMYDINGNYKVNLSIGDNYTQIYSDRENIITLESYNNFNNTSDDVINDGAYIFENNIVSTIINITISNTGENTMKLYSLFPGNRDTYLNNTYSTYVNKNSYCNNTAEGVWFKYKSDVDTSKLQTQNQFITFRINDVWTGEKYYADNVGIGTNNLQNSENILNITEDDKLGMVAYPYISTEYGLCIDSDNVRSYATINPGQELVIPIWCSYVATEPNTSIKKTLSFDLRTSLYNDPINYTFTIIGKNTASIQDKLTNTNKKRFWDRIVEPVKYNTTVK